MRAHKAYMQRHVCETNIRMPGIEREQVSPERKVNSFYYAMLNPNVCVFMYTLSADSRYVFDMFGCTSSSIVYM